jgi:hypothetical protein|tara:strand:+ start:4112 stop:5875 length:1764 start_codon:yes stop_codon:yes gene_type:complete
MASSPSLARLSLSAAASWPAFWILAVINALIAAFPSPDSTARFEQRLLAVAVGHVAMFGLVFVARQVEKQRTQPFTDPVTWIVLALSSLARALLVSSVLVVLDTLSTSDVASRVLSGIVVGVVTLALTTTLLTFSRTYHTSKHRLLVTVDQLTMSSEASEAEISHLDDQLLASVEHELRSNLADDSRTVDAEALERLAQDVVRPASHAIAARTRMWTPPEPEAPRAQLRAIDALQETAHGKPFMPVPTALVLLIVGAPSVVESVDPGWSLLYGLLGFVIVLALLGAANRLLQKLPANMPDFWRLISVIGMAVLVSLLFTVVSSLVSHTTGRAVVDDVRTRVVLSLFMAVILLLIAFAKGTYQQAGVVLGDLQEYEGRLRWRMARLRQVQWVEQQRLARLLHGPLQSILENGSRLLRSADDTQAGAVRSDVWHQITTTIAPSYSPDTEHDWNERLDRIIDTWLNVIDVTIDSNEAVNAMIEADFVGRAICEEIASQAIANAVRHGDATQITLRWSVQSREVAFTSLDNGQGPGNDDSSNATNAPGLGTQFLADCTTQWSRTYRDDGTKVDARIPISPVHEVPPQDSNQ